MPIKFSCGRLFFFVISFECAASTTLCLKYTKKRILLDIWSDIVEKGERERKGREKMKIRNIPQKPFPTVDSDMKSSNFQIKLKVFRTHRKHKKENFLPTLLTAFSSFLLFCFSFLQFFSLHHSVPRILFCPGILLFGSYSALLLYKMRQCRHSMVLLVDECV